MKIAYSGVVVLYLQFAVRQRQYNGPARDDDTPSSAAPRGPTVSWAIYGTGTGDDVGARRTYDLGGQPASTNRLGSSGRPIIGQRIGDGLTGRVRKVISFRPTPLRFDDKSRNTCESRERPGYRIDNSANNEWSRKQLDCAAPGR